MACSTPSPRLNTPGVGGGVRLLPNSPVVYANAGVTCHLVEAWHVNTNGKESIRHCVTTLCKEKMPCLNSYLSHRPTLS